MTSRDPIADARECLRAVLGDPMSPVEAALCDAVGAMLDAQQAPTIASAESLADAPREALGRELWERFYGPRTLPAAAREKFCDMAEHIHAIGYAAGVEKGRAEPGCTTPHCDVVIAELRGERDRAAALADANGRAWKAHLDEARADARDVRTMLTECRAALADVIAAYYDDTTAHRISPSHEAERVKALRAAVEAAREFAP